MPVIGDPVLTTINPVAGQVDASSTPGPVLLVNIDLSNTAYAGYRNTITPGGTNTIAIPPLGAVTMDGSRQIFACAAVPLQLQIVPGGGTWSPSAAQIAEQIGLINLNVTSVGALDWINITQKPYNCDPTGIKDSTAGYAAAQAASAVSGIPKYAPAGTYLFNSAAVSNLVGEGATIGDAPYDPFDYGDTLGTIFKIGPAYAGTSFMGMSSSSATIVAGPRLYNLVIDGSGSPASVDGPLIQGHVSDVIMSNVILSRLTGRGLVFQAFGGFNPLTARLVMVRARQCVNVGMQFSAVTDLSAWDLSARGCGGTTLNGITIGFCANSHFTDIRAEFNGKNGIECNGNGGYTLLNPSTDRNSQSGIAVTGAGPFTSTQPINIIGPQCRRDGSSLSGSGIAIIGAVTPVIIDNPAIQSGLDDGGGGSNTPGNGITIQNATSVGIGGKGYVQAATNPLNILGGNTYLDIDTDDIVLGTGTNTGSQGAAGAPVLSHGWVAVNPLSNAWAVAPAYSTAAVRLVKGNCVQFDMLMTPGGGANNNDGTIVANLPARFRPTQTKTIPATTDVLGAGSPRFSLDVLGNLKCFSIAAASTQIGIDATVPLDTN